jgi:translation initiation factor 5B
VQEVTEEVEEVEFESDKDGTVLKADTLGSLEALIKSLKDIVPIKKAEVGNITKSDVIDMKSFNEPKIFLFGLKPTPEIQQLSKDNKVKIFASDVIYSLIDGFEKWEKDKKKRQEEALLAAIVKPGRVKALPGYVFRQKKPAVFGVEVIKGTVKPGYRLVNKAGKIVGEVKEVQKRGEGVEEAKMGDKVALSMPDVTIGKDVNEGDTLNVFLSNDDKTNLNKIRDKLSADVIELLEEQ